MLLRRFFDSLSRDHVTAHDLVASSNPISETIHKNSNQFLVDRDMHVDLDSVCNLGVQQRMDLLFLKLLSLTNIIGTDKEITLVKSGRLKHPQIQTRDSGCFP